MCFLVLQYDSRLELKIFEQLGDYQATNTEQRKKNHFTPKVSFSTLSVGSIQHLGSVEFHLALGVVSGMEARVGTVH